MNTHRNQPSRSLAIVLLAVGLIMNMAMHGHGAEDWTKGWTRLGSRRVNPATERDEIRLTHKGAIQQLVLEVRRASVSFKDVKVHLLSGAVLDIPVRSLIREGDRTRVIDLPGNARIIRKIEFTYESLRLRQAEVVIWGRKN